MLLIMLKNRIKENVMDYKKGFIILSIILIIINIIMFFIHKDDLFSFILRTLPFIFIIVVVKISMTKKGKH